MCKTSNSRIKTREARVRLNVNGAIGNAGLLGAVDLTFQ